MQLLHKSLVEKFKKAERLPKQPNVSEFITANEVDTKITDAIDEIPVGGIEEAPVDGDQYARKNAGWEKVVSTGGGSILLATEYDLSAVDGILICSEYNPGI